MPIIKSAKKRMKQDAVRRDRNRVVKNQVKSATKKFTAEPTTDNFKQAQSQIDKAVKKGVLKKNTAARRKANLAKQVKR